jgi:hypothetical protein
MILTRGFSGLVICSATIKKNNNKRLKKEIVAKYLLLARAVKINKISIIFLETVAVRMSLKRMCLHFYAMQKITISLCRVF